MGMLGDLDSFLQETSDLGAPSEEPTGGPSVCPQQELFLDRPWKQIDVTAYIGVAEWLVAKPFDIAANRFAKSEEEKSLIVLDDDDKESIRPLLTEALQKCIHDLKANFLQNPYAGLAVGLAALGTAKSASLKVQRMRSAKHPSHQSPNLDQQPRSQPKAQQQDRGVTPIRQDSSMESGRTEEYVGGSSSAVSQGVGRQSFYVDELGDAAG
jgi:hypothetical protein